GGVELDGAGEGHGFLRVAQQPVPRCPVAPLVRRVARGGERCGVAERSALEAGTVRCPDALGDVTTELARRLVGIADLSLLHRFYLQRIAGILREKQTSHGRKAMLRGTIVYSVTSNVGEPRSVRAYSVWEAL